MLLVVSGLVALGCGGGTHVGPAAPTAPPAGDITAADLTPSSHGGPPAIAPKVLEPYRIAGEKNVFPDADVLSAARLSGIGRLMGSFKFCLDTSGHVVGVKMLRSTTAPSYDREIMRTIEQWAYAPIVLDGKPIAVCSAVTFIVRVR